MNHQGLSFGSEPKSTVGDILPIGQLTSFIRAPIGELHVMTIPDWLGAAIGARTRLVVFSAASMEKNKRRHPDLTVEEYATLPGMNGTSVNALIIQDRHNACVVIQNFGRRYLVAIKASQSGESVFVSSFHRIDDEAEIQRKLKRGHLIVPP